MQKRKLMTYDPLRTYRLRKHQRKQIDRAIEKVADYTACNDFELYMTITIDPRRLRNYTPNSAGMKVSGWLHRQSLKSRKVGKELKFIYFPDYSEQKKLLEYHVFFSGHAFELRRSDIIDNGKLLYTAKGFRYGFTKVRSIKDLTKQEVFDLALPFVDRHADGSHVHRYNVSRNLDTSSTEVNTRQRVAVNSLGEISANE